MANFEAFRWVISSSINLLFLKSAYDKKSHEKNFLLLLFKMTCSKGFPDPNNKSGEVGGIFDLPPSDERKLRSPGTDKLF